MGKSGKAPKEIRQVLSLIEGDLKIVEERINAQARSFDPAVEGYVSYACGSSGKRLRPALVLFAGGATGPSITPDHINLAVILELIHVATLVHDDIMDGAELRRDRPTPNARWGNAISVLLGDCLFAHALKLSTEFEDVEISRRIAIAAKEVCTGEILQTQRRFDLSLSKEDYFRIIEMKTAALFSVASELGAVLSGADKETVDAMRQYGLKLGTAYQIYDDCLDIAGDEKEAGKTLGTDLRKGKLTLPVLNLLQAQKNGHHAELSRILLSGTDDDLQQLAKAVRDDGALRSSIDAARQLISEAENQLLAIPANPHRQALLDIAGSLNGILDRFEA